MTTEEQPAVHFAGDAQSDPEPAAPSLPGPDPGVYHHEPASAHHEPASAHHEPASAHHEPASTKDKEA